MTNQSYLPMIKKLLRDKSPEAYFEYVQAHTLSKYPKPKKKRKKD